MKLVLYGGGSGPENIAIDQAVLRNLRNKKPKITYIPSSSYDAEEDFQAYAWHYKKLNINQVICLPADVPVDAVMKKYAFDSDIIHLSGGNTYYFLHHLRKSSYLGRLRQFVKRGGTLSGLSAGAIIMTPNISMAGYPEFDRDENFVNIKTLNSLSLVDFEFFPHYKNSKRYEKAMLAYSKKINRIVYACPDGAGIFINGDRKTFFGKVYCFFQGAKLVI